MGGSSPSSALHRALSRFWIPLVVGAFLCVAVFTQWDATAQFMWRMTHWPFIASLSDDPQFMYEAGTYYMDAASETNYDLVRAEVLLRKTVEVEPSLPYGFHQLARVTFLKGEFETALALINKELLVNPSPSPSSYYIRGLIRGFMSDYTSAAEDYEAYLHTDPTNWAAINDYAWVLLKDNRPREALVALDWGLMYWPKNPWLLNSKATAHFELQQLALAKEAVESAAVAVLEVREEAWLQAYPGNDPLIAPEGVAAFRLAVQENMHTISLAFELEQKTMQ